MNFDFLNISSSFMTFMKFSCLRACEHHASPKSRLCLTCNIPQHLAELKAISLPCQHIPKSTNWMLPKGAFSCALLFPGSHWALRSKQLLDLNIIQEKMGLGVISSYIFMGCQLTHPTSLWVVSWLILGHFRLPAWNSESSLHHAF